MRRNLQALFLLLAAGIPAMAQTVPVPQRRPAPPGDAAPPASPSPPASSAPQAKPGPQENAAQPPAAEPPPGNAAAMAKLRWSACPALMDGSVAGRLGEPVADGDCGVDSPVIVTAVGGVKLSGEATITCEVATALAAYVPKVAAAARDIMGSPLATIVGGNGYECRNRNRAQSGKLSQHAFANAMDISAFTLADGRSVTVAGDWPQPVNAGKEGPPVAQWASTAQAKFLAAVHAAACLHFTTVLGPDADAAHRDHLHFDLGCHGRDCKYLICQ
jgi:hypothetical protein